jgi:hypothetical protein
MSGELDWNDAIGDIPEKGVSRERVATSEERQLIARAFDLLACSSLSTKYTILPSSKGSYLLTGYLEAELQQACVVTLEPVVSLLKETFTFALWPSDAMPAPPSGELDLDEEPEAVAIVDGRIEIGRVVHALLAEALDPFPRAPGAILECAAATPQGTAMDEPTSPFAVLAQMKTKG